MYICNNVENKCLKMIVLCLIMVISTQTPLEIANPKYFFTFKTAFLNSP